MNDFVIKEECFLDKYTGNGGDVIIPEGIRMIWDAAFADRSDINSIVLPYTVESIMSMAFYNCRGLKKIEFPEKINSIERGAFSGCVSLTSITLPKSIKYLSEAAFEIPSLTEFCICEESDVTIGKVFGDEFPEGLTWQLDELALRMDPEGFKAYITPQRWTQLSPDTKVQIFLTHQDAKMKKVYNAVLVPAEIEPMSEAIIQYKHEKLNKKECGAIAQFMLDYYVFISSGSLKSLYDLIAMQKTGTDAKKLVDANAGLKMKVDTASREPDDLKKYETKIDAAFSYMGFDDNGTKKYNIGNKAIHVVLQPDCSIAIIDSETGKTVKSIPKRGADPVLYEAATADCKAVQSGVKSIVRACRDDLFELYLSGEAFGIDRWRKDWSGNPITRSLASMVIWQQGHIFFRTDGNETVCANGNRYEINDENIRVASTMNMTADETAQWQLFFNARKILQPFPQIWEPNRSIEDITENRYAGYKISNTYLVNRKKLGISAYWDFVDTWQGRIMVPRSLELKGFTVEIIADEEKAEFEIKKIVPQYWNRRTNAIVSYFDCAIAYEMLKKDDMTIEKIIPQYTMEHISDFITKL